MATVTVTVTAHPSIPTSLPSGIDLGMAKQCLVALQTLSSTQLAASKALTQVSQAASSATAQSQSVAAALANPAGGTTAVSTSAAALAAAAARNASGGSTALAAAAARVGSAAAQSPDAKLLADRGQLVLDQQALTTAENNLDAAVLKAPLDGVVAQVGLSVGSRAATTDGVVIIGSGAAQVKANVTLSNVQQMQLGSKVLVQTVGSIQTLSGTVTQIGLLPTAAPAGTSTPSYPVVITIASGADVVPEGASATCQVITSSVSNALTIPASALTTAASGQTSVTTLDGDQPKQVNVSVGAIGQGKVQVLTGVAESDTLIIADLSAPLPSNDSLNTRQFGNNANANQRGG